MDSAELAALAREREARRGTPAPASAPLPSSWASRPSKPTAVQPAALLSAHRSIKLARGLGLCATLLAAIFLALGFGWRVSAICFLGAVGFARAGAGILHGVLPPTLIEAGAKPPTDGEIASTSAAGLFCLDGAKSLGTSLSAEYELALDSLAFVCTYGKKNCLTDQMYRGPLTLGKISGLVWGKLREGIIRC